MKAIRRATLRLRLALLATPIYVFAWLVWELEDCRASLRTRLDSLEAEGHP